MKTLFNDITEKLETISELNWVDEDKGQMNVDPAFGRPQVLFPAALVTLAIPNTRTLNDKQQIATLQVNITLCFDFTGQTNTKVPHAVRQQSLSYYDVVDKVHEELQGWTSGSFNSLDRQSFRQLLRPDGYKTVQLVYSSAFKEIPS